MATNLSTTESAILMAVSEAKTNFNSGADFAFISSRVVAAHPTTVTSIRKLVRRGLIYKRYGKEEYFLRDEGEAELRGSK